MVKLKGESLKKDSLYLNTFQAAITEYHRQGGLNNRNAFLTVLEAGKSEINVPADSISGENLLSIYRLSCCILIY